MYCFEPSHWGIWHSGSDLALTRPAAREKRSAEGNDRDSSGIGNIICPFLFYRISCFAAGAMYLYRFGRFSRELWLQTRAAPQYSAWQTFSLASPYLFSDVANIQVCIVTYLVWSLIPPGLKARVTVSLRRSDASLMSAGQTPRPDPSRDFLCSVCTGCAAGTTARAYAHVSLRATPALCLEDGDTHIACTVLQAPSSKGLELKPYGNRHFRG